jgi:hypothetical protein
VKFEPDERLCLPNGENHSAWTNDAGLAGGYVGKRPFTEAST